MDVEGSQRCINYKIKTNMKKLITSALVISSVLFSTLKTTAATNQKLWHDSHGDWAVFHTVAHSYFSSNGSFQHLSEADQAKFFDATEAIKERLQASNRPGVNDLLREIDLTENVFRFVWHSKPEHTEIDLNMEIPAAPAHI